MTSFRLAPTGRAVAACAFAALVLLSGCGEKKEVPSQTAARVDKQEISTQLLSFVVQQQRGLRPEQVDAASRQILDRLIDQQLAMNKATELGLDQDPRVVLAIDVARRDLLARAYFEKLGEGAAKPTADDVKKFYDAKPELFSQRKVYNLQEIVIEARPDQFSALRDQLSAAKNVDEFVAYLKAQGIRFAGNQMLRPAEQLPADGLERIAKLSDGQALMLPTATGAQVVVLAGSKLQPVTEEQARPAIEQALLNERRLALVENQMKSLRAAAKIEYVGKYAQPAASAPAAQTMPAASGASAPK